MLTIIPVDKYRAGVLAGMTGQSLPQGARAVEAAGNSSTLGACFFKISDKLVVLGVWVENPADIGLCDGMLRTCFNAALESGVTEALFEDKLFGQDIINALGFSAGGRTNIAEYLSNKSCESLTK